MPKPRKTPHVRRSLRFHMKISPVERAELERYAAERGLTLASAVRAALLAAIRRGT